MSSICSDDEEANKFEERVPALQAEGRGKVKRAPPSKTEGGAPKFVFKSGHIFSTHGRLNDNRNFRGRTYGRSGLSRASWRAQTVRRVVMPMAYQMNLLLAAFTGEPPPLLPPAPRGPCGADAVLGGSRTMR